MAAFGDIMEYGAMDETRSVLGLLNKIIKVLIGAVILLVIDIGFEVSFPAVRELNLYTDKLRKGKEIVFLQISDLHGRVSGSTAGVILAEVEKTKPAAVLITGDLVDYSTKDFSRIYTLIERLHSICPEIYFVSGNHEWSNPGRPELIKKLSDLGVKMLDNKGTEVSINRTAINLCGVDDPYRRMDRIEKAMKAADDSKYTILLSHSPGIRKRLGGYVPDLILCGHTHGGQVRLPWVGALIAPGEGLFPKFDKGSFKLEQGTIMYIDSGVGTSHMPVRFLNRSQISRLRIKGGIPQL
ncbi:MAG: metallophosphoesterase [Pseudomonadota bacterium]